MSIWEYALYRVASQTMTPPERERAATILLEVEAGSQAAAAVLRWNVLEIITDRRRRRAVRTESAAAD